VRSLAEIRSQRAVVKMAQLLDFFRLTGHRPDPRGRAPAGQLQVPSPLTS